MHFHKNACSYANVATGIIDKNRGTLNPRYGGDTEKIIFKAISNANGNVLNENLGVSEHIHKTMTRLSPIFPINQQ